MQNDIKQTRKNEQIKSKNMMVIFNDQNLGLLSKEKALGIAQQNSLDLVEISPHSNPPVCKIIDWGKFKYEQSKSKRKTIAHKIHEVKFGVNIADHDFNTKIKIIEKFLKHKDKVKILIFFKGRQHAHKDIGYELADRILEAVGNVKSTQPKQLGKNISFFIE